MLAHIDVLFNIFQWFKSFEIGGLSQELLSKIVRMAESSLHRLLGEPVVSDLLMAPFNLVDCFFDFLAEIFIGWGVL